MTIDRLNIRALYNRVKEEYPAAFAFHDHPKKISMPLSFYPDGGPVCEFVNTMTARLRDGTFGTKTVYVNEATGALSARTTVFGKHGDLIGTVRSDDLTALRCGLMTALAIELYMGGLPERMKVGLIGTGRINLMVARVLKELIPKVSFIAKGSPRDPEKNLKEIPARLPFFLSEFGECDAVVSCTSSESEDEVLQIEQFGLKRTSDRPMAFIAHDGGWIFGESFRQAFYNFSDHPEQMLKDDDFPFDRGRYEFNDLNKLRTFGVVGPDGPVNIYLSGMAYTDVIVAHELLKLDSGAGLTVRIDMSDVGEQIAKICDDLQKHAQDAEKEVLRRLGFEIRSRFGET
ncbi:MAG: hypothetical protein LPL29_14490 [Alphaproteobacteria bacterium]|nr:hypothetical protein [Alphaproteobacteria bacterium]